MFRSTLRPLMHFPRRNSNLARITTAFIAAILSLDSADAMAQAKAAETVEAIKEPIVVATNAFDKLVAKILALLPLLAVAIAVVVVFYLVGRTFSKFKLPYRFIRNPFVKDLAKQFTTTTFLLIGVLIALEVLNATSLVGAALGAAGVVGLAVGFAFRDIVENQIAGILLSLRHPFAPNDHVDIDGSEGLVVRLSTRATILLTPDGNHLRIPNAKVFKAVILNYTKNPQRRFDFVVGVGLNEDLLTVQELGKSVLSKMSAVLNDPGASASIDGLGDFAVNVHFYAWVDQSTTSFGKARSEAIRLVKVALDEHNIDMPGPTYNVNMLKPSTESTSKARAPQSSDEQETAASTHLNAQADRERSVDGGDLLSGGNPME
ncbi:MAG: mechanosensitive ion channel family protein [Polyangiales bacterium]